MSRSRKVSVVFYQADDKDDSAKDDVTTENDEVFTRKQQASSKSKSVDSEDSGVKSASASNDDEETPKFRGTGRRKSRVSLASIQSSPLFDFPSFDELFETMGKTKLKIHRVSTSRQPLSEKTETKPESIDVQNMDVPGTAIDIESDIKSKRENFQRQDTMMMHSMSSLLINYGEASKGLADFRQRTGNAIQHKYLTCCRLDSTVFIFLYVLFGILLVCTGLLCFLDCTGEVLMSCYLLIDGVLSVFVFPILIMEWSKRIGGCISATEETGSGTFWGTVLLIRALFVVSGTVIVIYRILYDDRPFDNSVCHTEYLFLLVSVILEWTILILVIFCPYCVCAIIYGTISKKGAYFANHKSEKLIFDFNEFSF